MGDFLCLFCLVYIVISTPQVIVALRYGVIAVLLKITTVELCSYVEKY